MRMAIAAAALALPLLSSCETEDTGSDTGEAPPRETLDTEPASDVYLDMLRTGAREGLTVEVQKAVVAPGVLTVTQPNGDKTEMDVVVAIICAPDCERVEVVAPVGGEGGLWQEIRDPGDFYGWHQVDDVDAREVARQIQL